MAYNQSSRDSMADGQAIIGPHSGASAATGGSHSDAKAAGGTIVKDNSISGASLSGVGDGAESTIVKTNSISKGNQREQAPIVENNAGNVNKNEEAIDWSPIVTCYALLDDIQYKMGKIEENFDAIAS